LRHITETNHSTKYSDPSRQVRGSSFVADVASRVLCTCRILAIRRHQSNDFLFFEIEKILQQFTGLNIIQNPPLTLGALSLGSLDKRIRSDEFVARISYP